MTLAHGAARIMMEFKKEHGWYATHWCSCWYDYGQSDMDIETYCTRSCHSFLPVGRPFILNPSSTYFWQSGASNSLLHKILFALFVKHALSGYKVALGFTGICRDLVCWTIVFACFHGLVCFGGVFVVDSNTDNTGWQDKKATTVWCQCEDRWID